VIAGEGAITAGHLWRVDALSALLATLIAGVATLACWIGPGLSSNASETRAFRFYANLFAATMLVAVTTSNLGVMWVAIEATTVTSALLIPVHRTKASVEASWKYLFIGSVGIALAFTGTVLAFVDFSTTGGVADNALNWTTLLAAAPTLHPEVTRVAFVFLLVGFGTKAGLAPMHTWLPDAHSEAPAPLSAMMSGVLLAVALYALARWKVIIDASLGSPFTDTLLLVIAIPTIVIGSLSLVTQSQYKRLLAYSSIEHIGLACFGLALGPLGIFAALLHVTGHALAKSTAFLLSGRVLARYGTQDMDHARGLLTALPGTGALFALGVLALVGLPPFSLFASEVLLIRAGWSSGHHALTAVVLVFLLIAFASLVHQAQRMLLGRVPNDVVRGEPVSLSLVLLAVPLVALAWIGAMLPASLTALLTHATEVLHP
jgi:hydrogenase-4 component F